MGIRLLAEASCNHGGSLERAIEMAETAKHAGADTVKYQRVSPDGVPPGARNFYERVAFSQEQWRVLKHEVGALGLRFLCTPQTVDDFKALLELGIDEVKVSSDNYQNEELGRMIADRKIPAIISTGMRTGIIPNHMGDYTWMICTSEYPCPPESVRLLPKTTKTWHKIKWGFSDHTQSSTAAILAMGMGARVFEKHFWDGVNQCEEAQWACTPQELKDYFDDLKEAWIMLGEGLPAVTEAEKKLGEELNAH